MKNNWGLFVVSGFPYTVYSVPMSSVLECGVFKTPGLGFENAGYMTHGIHSIMQLSDMSYATRCYVRLPYV